MVHIRTLMEQVVEIDEGRMKDIFTANQEGKSAKEIAKALKLPLGTVKKILGEEEELEEFSDSQLDVLARQYKDLKGKTISVDQANKLRKIFDRIPDRSLDALRRKHIPFLSGLALSRMIKKGMPVKEENIKEAKYTINYEVESDSGADDRYTGNQEMTVNAFSPKDAVKKYGQEVNKLVKKASDRGSRSVLDVYMNYIEKDGNEIPDREVDKLNDYASDFIYKGVYNSYMKEARWQIEGQLSYKGIGSYDGFHMVIDAPNERAAEQKAYKELDKARDRKKIGPGGGGSVEDAEIESIEKTSDRLQAPSTYQRSDFDPAEVKEMNCGCGQTPCITYGKQNEAKAPYRISYSDKYGKHAGFEDGNSLQDIQNKAQKLRAKGFKIDKMGRNTSPIDEANIDVDNVDKTDSSKEKELKIKLDKEKDQDTLEKQLIAAQGQINILKAKLENEKNRAIKPEPNPETGEVPLTIGVAHKYLKDKQDKEMKKDKKDVHEGARQLYETIKGLKNKAEKSGMPYSILKKVYDRGMAAWRGGHRPGTSQQQWAFARVNSFVTKSSGTWGGADKDLAKQVRGSK